MKGAIVGGVLLLAIGGIGGYMAWNSRTQVNEEQNTTPTPVPNTETSAQKKFRDLLTLGSTQKCTFSSEDPKFSGTVYMNAGKVRGDYTLEAEGATLQSHMIVENNTTLYMWQEGQKTGLKMTFDATAESNSASETTPAGQDTLDNPVSYECSPWTADASLFVPPSTVSFSSMGDIVLPQNGNAPDTCSACDALEGNDKTKCLQVLKCN